MLTILRFLKTYTTKNVIADAENVHEQTVRKWKWKFVRKIAQIKTVGY